MEQLAKERAVGPRYPGLGTGAAPSAVPGPRTTDARDANSKRRSGNDTHY